MAKGDDRKPRIETHPLVAKLLPNPDDPPRLVAIRGYIGPATDKNSVRIHHDLDFSSYTEVPKDAIQHVEPFNPDRSSSPTVVLVSADTPIRTVHRATQADEAGFLAGGIAARQLRGKSRKRDTDYVTECCPATLHQTDQCPEGPKPPPPGPPRPVTAKCDGELTDTCCCPSTLTTTEGY